MDVDYIAKEKSKESIFVLGVKVAEDGVDFGWLGVVWCCLEATTFQHKYPYLVTHLLGVVLDNKLIPILGSNEFWLKFLHDLPEAKVEDFPLSVSVADIFGAYFDVS